MATTKVYDMKGAVVGEIELNDSVFGIEPNVAVMHASVKNYLVIFHGATKPQLLSPCALEPKLHNY